MHPPDSYNPYQPPAPDYLQPGGYPAYAGQHPGYYPYPYHGAPPKPDDTGRIIKIVVIIVALVILVPIVIAGVLVVYLQTLPSSGGSENYVTSLGLRATNQGNGNWLMDVTAGAAPVSSVRLQVTNPATGVSTVSKTVAGLAPAYADPDATYNDNNGNARIDAGDSFVLKSSGGHIVAGYKVQLLAGSSTIGVIKELPS